MNPFVELLERAGHRPAKTGTRWHCVNCPSGKPPALSVDLVKEVYFCHRCGTRGNVITLKKELGLLENRQWTRDERRRFAQRQERIDRELQSFLEWLYPLRREYILKFRSSLDVERIICSLAKRKINSRLPIDSWILDIAFEASRDREIYSACLNYLDDPRNRERIVRAWKGLPIAA